MKKILVCLDTSPRAPHVLAAAIDLARNVGGKMMLFRSVGLPPDISKHEEIIGVSPNEILERLVSNAREGLVKFRADVPDELIDPEMGIDVHVGVPWNAICVEAAKRKVDVIVIGSHGYGGVDRLLGTTAAKVVNHAECSVLVVR